MEQLRQCSTCPFLFSPLPPCLHCAGTSISLFPPHGARPTGQKRWTTCCIWPRCVANGQLRSYCDQVIGSCLFLAWAVGEGSLYTLWTPPFSHILPTLNLVAGSRGCQELGLSPVWGSERDFAHMTKLAYYCVGFFTFHLASRRAGWGI